MILSLKWIEENKEEIKENASKMLFESKQTKASQTILSVIYKVKFTYRQIINVELQL